MNNETSLRKISQQKRFMRIGSALVCLIGSTLLGFNCSQFSSDSSALSGRANSALGDSSAQVPVGLLSSEQILKAMISATGTEGLGDITTSDDNQINTTYLERTGSLPSGQDLSLATGPTQIAITNLAGTVCAKAIATDAANTDASDRLFFKEMDFSKGLSSQSSDSVSGAFERLARNAWRRDATSEEIETIISFAQEFTSLSSSMTDPAQTKLLAVSTCAAVLSSVDALTY